MAALHRVYFDTNDGPPSSVGDFYMLHLNQSRLDLAAIPGGPREGMHVVIYMTGELEMEAVLKFDAEWGWLAAPVPKTIKYY